MQQRVKYEDKRSVGKTSYIGSIYSIPDITRHTLQWEDQIRKLSEECKSRDHCKAVLDVPCHQNLIKQFDTGSSYEGTWNAFGMDGYGIYRYPSGVEYEGEIENGEFHGAGVLRYPNGIHIRGTWERGEIRERKIIFNDGLEYKEEDFKYCQKPDRRFAIEYREGIQPAGKSFLTAEQPTRPIPRGLYDTGDGFYDPKTKTIYKYDDKTQIVRGPSPAERKWIVENCRTNNDIFGPRPDLYEHWTGPKQMQTDSASTSDDFIGTANDLLWTTHEADPSFINEDGAMSLSSCNFWASKRPFIKFDPTLQHDQRKGSEESIK